MIALLSNVAWAALVLIPFALAVSSTLAIAGRCAGISQIGRDGAGDSHG